MNALDLFLPCPLGVQELLADEVRAITGQTPQTQRAGVWLRGSADDMLRLNLHSRLAQRVLIRVAHQPYRSEEDLYLAARDAPWQQWFEVRDSFRIDTTASRCPLQSLNFATLRIKDGVVDGFRKRTGQRPSVNTQQPRVRLHAHLDAQTVDLFVDTSGEPLFKRGWRQDKGDAPLKESLAAALIAATQWDPQGEAPLYDPCCGSGTIAIEAAQMACRIAPGLQRRFAFEQLRNHSASAWRMLREEAQAQITPASAPLRVFGSDLSHRMVDFAQRNAQRAGVAQALDLRGGDALQRLPPCQRPGVLLLNPPYGERITVGGVSARGENRRFQDRRASDPAPSQADGDAAARFYGALAAHWKSHFDGWSAWVLTPDAKLPSLLRLRESRRIPIFNGAIECRLLRFDLRQREIIS